MKNITGPPVKGDELKFRDKDVSEILTRIRDGNSILMIGLRRIGKSSVMIGVCDQMPDEWTASYHNLQDKSRPSDLFTALLDSFSENDREHLVKYWSKAKTIPSRVVNAIKSTFRKLGGFEVEVELNQDIIDYWKPLTQGMQQVIANKDHPIVMVLDEFPFFIEHMLEGGVSKQTVEEILGLLRCWRHDYDNFMMVIGGSISLDRILSKWDIHGSTINDFSRYYLPPLTRDQASLFLRELRGDYGLERLNDEKIEIALNLIEDYYPFFLHVFFQQFRAHDDILSLEILFENYFIPGIHKSYFVQFSERLKKHYSADQQIAAKLIFTLIANSQDKKASFSQLRAEIENLPGPNTAELDDLLVDLISDEFLSYNARINEYQFTARLVGRWWQMTRGK